MTGPVVGSVRNLQTSSGDLDVTITADCGQPSSTYEIFLTCGPSHNVGCGFASIASLMTDVAGFGSSTVLESVGALLVHPSVRVSKPTTSTCSQAWGDVSKGVLTAGRSTTSSADRKTLSGRRGQRRPRPSALRLIR